MTQYFIARSASRRIEDIFLYTLERWGEAQADRYLDGLYDTFANISEGTARSRPIPRRAKIDGFMTRYQHHIVFWQEHSLHGTAILSVLHESMDLPARLLEDIESGNP